MKSSSSGLQKYTQCDSVILADKTVNRWCQVLCVNSEKQLDSKYNSGTPGNSTYNSAFLKAGEGPDKGQYLALSTYHYEVSLGRDPLASVFPYSYAPTNTYSKTKALLDRWYVDTSGKTFEQKQTSQIINNQDDAIKIYISGNNVTINANVQFQEDNLERHGGNGEYLGILAAAGIKEHWSGDFWMDGQWVTLDTTFSHETNTGRNIVTINIHDSSGGAYAYNDPDPWTKGGNKVIEMYSTKPQSGGGTLYPDWHYINTAAHEFGHSLGIYDFYQLEDQNRNIILNAVPNDIVASYDIMRDTQPRGVPCVNIKTISVMLDAMKTNTAQEFRK